MPKFYVYVPEVHYQTVSITASTPEEAVKLVDAGEASTWTGVQSPARYW